MGTVRHEATSWLIHSSPMAAHSANGTRLARLRFRRREERGPPQRFSASSTLAQPHAVCGRRFPPSGSSPSSFSKPPFRRSAEGLGNPNHALHVFFRHPPRTFGPCPKVGNLFVPGRAPASRRRLPRLSCSSLLPPPPPPPPSGADSTVSQLDHAPCG